MVVELCKDAIMCCSKKCELVTALYLYVLGGWVQIGLHKIWTHNLRHCHHPFGDDETPPTRVSTLQLQDWFCHTLSISDCYSHLSLHWSCSVQQEHVKLLLACTCKSRCTETRKHSISAKTCKRSQLNAHQTGNMSSQHCRLLILMNVNDFISHEAVELCKQRERGVHFPAAPP